MGKKFLKLALLQLLAEDSLNEQLEKGKGGLPESEGDGSGSGAVSGNVEQWIPGSPQEAEVLEKTGDFRRQ